MACTLTLHRPFVADHFHDLPGFQEDRHGHNWEVEATVDLEPVGGEPALRQALDAWAGGLDYRLLNDLPELAGRNPTAEVLAERAFLHLQAAGLRPLQVRIREKANYWARCRASEAP